NVIGNAPLLQSVRTTMGVAASMNFLRCPNCWRKFRPAAAPPTGVTSKQASELLLQPGGPIDDEGQGFVDGTFRVNSGEQEALAVAGHIVWLPLLPSDSQAGQVKDLSRSRRLQPRWGRPHRYRHQFPVIQIEEFLTVTPPSRGSAACG